MKENENEENRVWHISIKSKYHDSTPSGSQDDPTIKP